MQVAFSYYGGKSKMSSNIVSLLPPHKVYVEPFCGSAAVLFKKGLPNVGAQTEYREVINDLNGELINSYKQLRDNNSELHRVLNLTPHSRLEYKMSKEYVGDFDPLERARCFFTNVTQSFGGALDAGWSTAVRSRSPQHTWRNKTDRIPAFLKRMKHVSIENEEALNIIDRYDSEDTVFYCDPPYPGAHQGHYSGYTFEDFNSLVRKLDNLKGSALVSCYHREEFGIPDTWERFDFGTSMTVGGNTRKSSKSINRKRTETIYRKVCNKH